MSNPAKKPVKLAGKQGPDPTGTVSTFVYGLGILEIVVLYQVVTLSPSWIMRWSAYVLIALQVFVLLIRPWAIRRANATHSARWRVLRRVTALEAADLADSAPADPMERLAFTSAVVAMNVRIADIISDEERLANKDLGVTAK
jgi:hypothetical protein